MEKGKYTAADGGPEFLFGQRAADDGDITVSADQGLNGFGGVGSIDLNLQGRGFPLQLFGKILRQGDQVLRSADLQNRIFPRRSALDGAAEQKKRNGKYEYSHNCFYGFYPLDLLCLL